MRKLTALIIALGVATLILSGLWVYAALSVWSNEVIVIVEPEPQTNSYVLTLNDPADGTVNTPIVFTGDLKNNDNPVEGETVTLYIYDESLSGYFTTGRTGVTDENGEFSISWTPTEDGTYNFKAYV